MGLSTNLLISITIELLLVSSAHGAARFTVVPPSVLYVSFGETARFVWNYNVDNRTEEFDIASPRWNFYAVNGSASQIGYAFYKRKWIINKNTCPARLLNPVRVSTESIATLVIHNVTLADSGTYACSLVLTARSPITSKVKLIVTSLPKLNLSATSMHLKEYSGLIASCSAVGTPTPNITWGKVQGNITLAKHQGAGDVLLKITNITRHESGMYQCCASNNPNEYPVCRRLRVTVMYKPEIDFISSSTRVTSFTGNTILLYCVANGVPSPLFTWKDPRDQKITTGIHNATNSSVLELKTGNAGHHYGSYTCRATNKLGYDKHVINVTETVSPTSKTLKEKTLQDKIIQGSIFQKVFPTTSKSLRGKATLVTNPASTLYKERSHSDKNILLLAVGGVMILVLVATIVILVIIMFKRRGKNEDAEKEPRNGQATSLPLETGEMIAPIYAEVDLSRKKKNSLQGEIPIYAQVDKTKKKRPGEIIYTEVDHQALSKITPGNLNSPPLPDRCMYAQIKNDKDTKLTGDTYCETNEIHRVDTRARYDTYTEITEFLPSNSGPIYDTVTLY